MNEPSASTEDETAPTYIFRPSLLGAPREFTLGDGSLGWTAGAASGHVPFRDVRRVRMSFQPASMQSQRFVTEIWADRAPKLTIVSSSWKSLVEQERLDKPYRAFVAELHRRLQGADVPVQFERGAVAFKYWPGLVVFAALSLGMAWLVVRGLQERETAGALFVAAFLALFVWQGGTYFRRNRPGRYPPDELPADLLPTPR